MGISSVTTDIAYDAQLAVGRLEALHVDERWDRLGEVDAVDEDVGLDDLWVGTWPFSGFGQIPALYIVAAHFREEVNSTSTAAAEGTKHETARLAACDLLTRGNILLELGNQLILVVVIAPAFGVL